MLVFAFLAAAAGRVSEQEAVSPVEKVVSLLEDLQAEVQTEGAAEAATYETFACFCRTTTNEKVASIETREGTVESLTATLKDETAILAATKHQLKELNHELDSSTKDLQKATAVRDADHAVYAEKHADVTAAHNGIKDALSSIGGAQSLVEQKQVMTRSLALADALSLKPAAVMLAQVPAVPTTDYDNHGSGVLDVLDGLKDTFAENKVSLEDEETAAQTAFDGAAASKRAQIAAAQAAIGTAEDVLAETESNIATAQEDLTEEEALLHDDQAYLKDLTGQCEAKAREWDQRSSLRKDELEALSQAHGIIAGTVASKASASGAGGRHGVAAVAMVTSHIEVDQAEGYADVVFAQHAVRRHAHATSATALRKKAIVLLKTAAAKTKSVRLAMLAMRMAADPFAKIKTLIQQLIERLASESQEEASQKGWCDTELARANTDRDYRHKDTVELTASVHLLEARRQKLEERSADLSAQISQLEQDHSQASATRAAEKAENKQTLESSAAGKAALDKAIGVLQAFYKKGGKASVSLVQASPVDQDLAAAGAGHKGAYKGKQAEAGGILGMLETIASDFERTTKETTEAENQAHRAFVAFEQETKASIRSKETGRKNTESELLETNGNLQANLESLSKNQALLDGSLETLEKLRPACIDTGMSYEERVARREAEIDALKNAVCVLDEEDGELPECQARLFLQARMRAA